MNLDLNNSHLRLATMIESTGLEAVFRGSSQALGCKSLPGCVTLCDLGLFLAVDAFLPSLSDHPSPHCGSCAVRGSSAPVGG